MLNYANIKEKETRSASSARSIQSYAGRSTFQLRDNRPGSFAGTNISQTYFTDNRLQSIIQKKQAHTLVNWQPTHTCIQKKENKTGLPDNLKSGIENFSGISMDDVKVHYNSAKPAQLNALAYAQGPAIHIGPGQERHLPHEAWHVVQQKQGRVKPTIQMKGNVSINDDKGLEKEADVMSGKMLQIVSDKQGTETNPVSISPLNNLIQRKVGVEYETNWKVDGNNRENHKKPILSKNGWHLESDNNALEFVTFPPVGSPERLRSIVDSMAQVAITVRNASGQFAAQDIGSILGNSVKPGFKQQHFQVSADPDMSAKAQFSFGLSLKNMAAFFDKLASRDIKEAGAPDGGSEFGFRKRQASVKDAFGRSGYQWVVEPETTKEYLNKSLAPGIEKSAKYRADMKGFSTEHSQELQGFLAYLAYSIKSMQVEYNDNFEHQNKAAHLAQELLKPVNAPLTVLQVAQSIGYDQDTVSQLNSGVFGTDRETDTIIAPAQLAGSLKKFKRRLQNFVFKRVRKGMNYPKYAFVIMNRSGFDKMFQSLSGADRNWFRKNIDRVIVTIGAEPNEPVFTSPYTYKTKANEDDIFTKNKGLSKGPNLKDWLESIVLSGGEKRDSLSPPKEFIMGDGKQDPDQSMGLLNKMDISNVESYHQPGARNKAIESKKAKVKQAIFELRAWGDFIKPEDWAKHSYEMAYLFAQMAPGDLTLETENTHMKKYADELNPLILERQRLKDSLIENNANLSKGEKTHRRLFNRGVRNRLFDIDRQIRAVEKKYSM